MPRGVEELWSAFSLGNPELADEVYLQLEDVPEDDPGKEHDDENAERQTP